MDSDINTSVVDSWIKNEFVNKDTRKNYRSVLRAYMRVLKIDDMESYLKKANEEIVSDFKTFLISMSERPSKTQRLYSSVTRMFLKEHGAGIDEETWLKIRRRGYIAKRDMAETQDRAPSKKELRKILDYMDIKGRALILFLASSGCRIGETLKLQTDDVKFDVDPPRAFIRGKTTKNGVGERTVFFSYEAKEAILNWLTIKDFTGKRIALKLKRTYKDPLLFPFTPPLVYFLFNNACRKAGLQEKDKRTRRRLLHIHSLRKFFRSNIGLDTDYTNALMGHAEYLDPSYRRFDIDVIAEVYRENMDRVSIYGAKQKKFAELERENEEQEKEIEEIRQNYKLLSKVVVDLQKALQISK